MWILPVMDVCQGQVVHARAGRRAEYMPLQSAWTRRACEPLELTRVFLERFGVIEWYVADLDALEGGTAQLDLIGKLAEQGLRLWLDAGVRDVRHAERGLDPGIERLIVASESLPSRDLLPALVQRFGPTRLVFSLDLYKGVPRGNPGVLSESPVEIVDEVVRCGFQQVIVLDTAAVGMARGPETHELCRTIRKRHPSLTLTTGGGVRHLGDLDQLAASGVDITLVGSALHADQEFAPLAFRTHARGVKIR
jgi:phosphoribosylformimino-5-aminoimidazole carboxamide ribotide isomerase